MKVAIIGASKDRTKYGNKAVRAYMRQGHEVYPVNPREDTIEGLPCFASVEDIKQEIDMASFYVPSTVGEKIAPAIVAKGIPLVYLNPGTESHGLVEKLKDGGVEVRMACSIIAVGIDPEDL